MTRIASVSWSHDRLDVVGRGTNDTLQHWWWDGHDWGHDEIGGTLVSDPAITSWAADRLDVVGRGTNNTLQHWWWDGHAWGHETRPSF